MIDSEGRELILCVTIVCLIIFLVVFVDLLGFSLILPLLPYYAEQYGASAIVVGLLTASYAAAQLVGAPILGRLSDQHGRRPILLSEHCRHHPRLYLVGHCRTPGAMVGDDGLWRHAWWRSTSAILALLFTSRILDGLTGGNISVAQAYISDITTPENRNKALGMIGAAFGLGFIIGPALVAI